MMLQASGGGHRCRATKSASAVAAQRLRIRARAVAYTPQSSQDLSSRSSVTYINRSVRPDEIVEAPGNVVVHGNVAGSVECGGDVMVWGRLSGHVHAGCFGDRDATISALELRGAQLVIAQATSLGAARITVPGPHTASVSLVGRSMAINLTPLGPGHPPVTPLGLTASVKRWLAWYPAAAAALLTGCYALLAGIALMVAPKSVLGLLFDTSSVSSGWIRLGGVLFATFGGQYLGAAVVDYRLAAAAGSSSSGCPDMPFRPHSPHPYGAASGSSSGSNGCGGSSNSDGGSSSGMTSNGSSASAGTGGPTTSTFNTAARSPAAAAPAAGAAMPHGDTSPGGSMEADDSSGGGLDRPVGRSVPADQLSRDQVQELRRAHRARSKAAAAAALATAAAATDSTPAGAAAPSSSNPWQAILGQPPQVPWPQHAQQAVPSQQPQAQQSQLDLPQTLQQQQQQPQQAAPPTWLFCSAGFYEASVWSRLGLAAAFCVLVAAGACQPGLLALAGLNLCGALSMVGALRRQYLIHVMGDTPEVAGMIAGES